MKKEKQRNQVKSSFYYIFWGAATVTVFVGQMYVGTGFRRMAESFEQVLDAPIRLDLGIPLLPPRHRMMVPDGFINEDYQSHDDLHTPQPL